MGFGNLIGLIIAVIIIAIIFIIWYFWTSLINCLADPIGCIKNLGSDIPFVNNLPQCPNTMDQIGPLLCREKCPTGYDSDNIANCYKQCPSSGAGTLFFCNHGTIPSSVGTIDTIPQGCPPGKVNYKGLCYSLPDSNWEVTSPGFIGLKCGADVHDDGTACWYDRGVGQIPQKKPCSDWDPSFRDDGTSCWSDFRNVGGLGGFAFPWKFGDGLNLNGAFARCEGVWGAGQCHVPGGAAMVYPTCQRVYPGSYESSPYICSRGDGQIKVTLFDRQFCPSGTTMDAGLCYPICQPGFSAVATNCSKSKQVQAQVGTLPDHCLNGKDLHGRLCYPQCPVGYHRAADNLEFCTSDCPPGFDDNGILGCKRPVLPIATHGIAEVGVCPAGKIKNQSGFCVPDPNAGILNKIEGSINSGLQSLGLL